MIKKLIEIIGIKATYTIIVSIVLFIIASFAYLIYQKNSLQDDLSRAENDIILVTKEFYSLHKEHENLEKNYKEQEEYHIYSISVLNKKHKIEINRASTVAGMKEKANEISP